MTILYTNALTSGSTPWGSDEAGTQVTGSLALVADPASGGGNCIRQRIAGPWDDQDHRAQLAWYAETHDWITDYMGGELYFVVERYYPEAFSAGGSVEWLSVFDTHAVQDEAGTNRWHTNPGFFVHQDGSMRVGVEWPQNSYHNTENREYTSTGMPVGEWFQFQVRMPLTLAGATGTLQVWFNNTLVLTQNSRRWGNSALHDQLQVYLKLYGSNNGDVGWEQAPADEYTRNFRVSDAFVPWETVAATIGRGRFQHMRRKGMRR